MIARGFSTILTMMVLLPAVHGHPGKAAMWSVFVKPEGITGRIVVPVCEQCAKQTRESDLLRYFTLAAGQTRAKAILTNVDRSNQSELELQVRYDLSTPTADLVLASTFFELSEMGHETICRVHFANRVEAFVLDLNTPSNHVRTASAEDRSTAWQFPALAACGFMLLMRVLYYRGSAT